MKRIFILSIFFTLAGIGLVFGQNNWKPGYIIYQNGDTLYGQIKYKENQKSISTCTFKRDNESDTKTLTTLELIGYRLLDGKFFISKQIKEAKSETPLFIEFLLKGKVSLYKYNDGKNRIFAEKDTVIYELKHTQEIQASNGNPYSYMKDKKEYVGTLNILFEDAKMGKEIATTAFRPKSLINITRTYHEKVCTDEKCVLFERATKPLHVRLGLLAGFTYNQFNFGDLILSNYKPGIVLGCRFDFLNIVDLQEKVSLTVDVTIQKYSTYTLEAAPDIKSVSIKYNGKKQYLARNGGYQSYTPLDVNLDILALHIPITVNYTFSSSKISPYIGGGLVNTIVLSQNSDLLIPDVYLKYDKAGKSIPKYQAGIIAKIGCSYTLNSQNSLFMEGDFEYSKSLQADQIARMTNKTIAIKCGYRF